MKIKDTTRDGIVAIMIGVAVLLILSSFFVSDEAHAMDNVTSPTSLQRGYPSSYTVSGYPSVDTGWDNGKYTVKYNGTIIFSGSTEPYVWNGATLNVYDLGGGIKYLQGSWVCYNWGTCGAGFGNSAMNILFDETTQEVFYDFGMQSPFVMSSTEFRVQNGDNIDFISFVGHTPTVYQSIPKPSPSFGVMRGTHPVRLRQSTTLTVFLYQGTDGKNYIVDSDFIVDDPFVQSFENANPLGFNGGDKTYFLAGSAGGSGTLYVQNFTSTGSPSTLLDTGKNFKSLTYFSNPKVYFMNTDWTTVSVWDMNCKTQGYDACRIIGGVNKCTDNSGNVSPGGELCGGSVTIPTNETCYDGIKNQDEVTVDNGGVCGSQTCSYQEVNNRYRVTGWYGTGSINDATIEYYGRATGSGFDDTGTDDKLGKDYVADITPPVTYPGYQFDKKSILMRGAYIVSSTGTIKDLFNGNGLRVRVPGYVTSPLLGTSFIGDPYIRFESTRPIQWMSIIGTGSVVYTGSGAIGCASNFSSCNNATLQVGKGYTTAVIGDGNGNEVQLPGYPGGVPISKSSSSKIYIDTTGAFGPVNGSDQSFSIKLKQGWADQDYILYGVDFGYMGDQFSQEYICKKSDGSYTQNGNDITFEEYQEISGSADGIRSRINDGTVSGWYDFSFGEMQGVGSGTDCSDIINQNTRAFLYSTGGSSVNTSLQSNFVISKDPWTCRLSLSSGTGGLGFDPCRTAYDGTNSILSTVFGMQSVGLSSIMSPINTAMQYIGTPVGGEYYCFAGKNLKFEDRATTYTDTRGVQHDLPYNDLSLFDLIFLAFLTMSSIFILSEYWSKG